MTRLSCHRLGANEVRLWLSLIAYKLGNLCFNTSSILLRRPGMGPAYVASTLAMDN